MKTWVKTIIKIKETSSTNAKLDTLKEALKDDSISNSLITLFHTNLNYNINSYLSDVSKLNENIFEILNSKINSNNSQESEKFFIKEIYHSLTHNLRYKKVEWVKVLSELASYCTSKEELEIYLLCITKKLVIGLSLKTFNKAIKDIFKNASSSL